VTIGAFLTPTALATVLHDAWGDTLLTRQIATCSLEKTRVKFGPNATGPFAEYTEIRSGPRNEDAEAPSVAVLVEKVTNFGGRANRGRFFVPGISYGDVAVGGGLASEPQTFFQTQANAFLARLDTEGLDMVLLHGASSDPTTVTSLNVDGRAATQRRRLRS